MRRQRVAVTVVLLLLALARPATAQTPGKVLSGYRYIRVQPPSYEGQVDAYGFGQYLLQKLREDKTWIVLSDLPAPEQQDPTKANESVTCVIAHSTNTLGSGAKLVFYDITGSLLTTVEGGPGLFSGYSFERDVKHAIDGALKTVQKDRRFDPSRVVDFVSRYGNVETVDLTEESLRRYLEDNTGRLHPLEGVWTASDGQYRLGLMRRGASDRVVAFVLETKHPLWRPKMLKATFEPTVYPDSFTMSYSMGNHQSVSGTAKLTGGLLSIPTTVDGRDQVITLVKNYPANGSSAVAMDPRRFPDMAVIQMYSYVFQ